MDIINDFLLEFDVINGIIIPIIASIIAAFIFWFFLNYIPEKTRKKKIRPRLECLIYKLYNNLFFFIECPFRLNNHSASYYQHKIKGGKITIEDFRIALQNKCLNDSYKYDENASKFICIGEVLSKQYKQLNTCIERVFDFHMYLTADEILLFEEIRTNIEKYSFDGNANIKIGTQILHPIVPNIAYMDQNFTDLYSLFLLLQELILKYSFVNKDMLNSKTIIYYDIERYKKCVSFIKKKYKNNKHFSNVFLAKSYYRLEKYAKFLKISEFLFVNKLDIISNRDFIHTASSYKPFNELLNKYYSKEKIKQMQDTLESEEKLNADILIQNRYLKDYYDNKVNKQTTK